MTANSQHGSFLVTREPHRSEGVLEALHIVGLIADVALQGQLRLNIFWTPYKQMCTVAWTLEDCNWARPGGCYWRSVSC